MSYLYENFNQMKPGVEVSDGDAYLYGKHSVVATEELSILGAMVYGGVQVAKGVGSSISSKVSARRSGRLPESGSLSNVEATKWYLDQEAKVKGMIDTTKPVVQQAKQAFDLRNQFRTQARDLMSDRAATESLRITDPNMTWEQVVTKYTNKGLSGDSLHQEIINASTRSRTSVNKSLGLK